jgi:hypothetical protein
MMRTNKVIRQFCQSLHCGFEWSLGRCAIHRNHWLIACAPTHKQHLSCRWLFLRKWTVWGKNNTFDPVPIPRERYGVQQNVERVSVWTIFMDLEKMATDLGDGTSAMQHSSLLPSLLQSLLSSLLYSFLFSFFRPFFWPSPFTAFRHRPPAFLIAENAHFK